MRKVLLGVSNVLILLSLGGFLFIFYPLLNVYLMPTGKKIKLPEKGYAITIPKINAAAPIVIDIDPFNKDIYTEALKKGVAHAKNTALPGQTGTIFLFAHSSGMPWELTRYNTIFLRIPELQSGDIILLSRDKTQYRYVVTTKKEVSPNEINYLSNKFKNQLILQTCTPIGTSLKRLLVFAEKE